MLQVSQLWIYYREQKTDTGKNYHHFFPTVLVAAPLLVNRKVPRIVPG
jgi:hypothetical protein